MGPNMNQPELPCRFAGSELCEKRHICGFFRNPEEEYQLLLPFIKEGFEQGEKAFHVVDPTRRGDHMRRLESAGIDVEGAEEKGQFQLCDWNQAYFPDGRFDQDRMLAMWQDVWGAAAKSGYTRTRLVAHMEWALEDREGVSDLIEYEARFNLVHDPRDPVICAYDLTRFSGDIIMDVLRTHPTIIIGGTLQQNPFFVPPEEFLQEIRERRAQSWRSRPEAN
jgi:hypothetical protein